MSEDRCVCCGDIIPEGRQVCPGCDGGVTTATIPGRCKNCRHWSRNEIRDTEFGVCFNIRGVSIIKHENGFCDRWRAV